MADFTVVIGNKNYSSWSLRGWLMARIADIEFEEILDPPRPARDAAHDPQALALRPRAGAAASRAGDLGIDRDRRISQ